MENAEKYYKSGEIIFEGEYLNGIRRKGKEYDEKGRLTFEWELLNGKRKVKGKEYYKNWKIKYEGE